MVGIISKKIRGKKYTYFEYFENGKTVQKYCGPEGSAKSKKTALQYEYSLLKSKRDEMIQKMKMVKEEQRKI